LKEKIENQIDIRKHLILEYIIKEKTNHKVNFNNKEKEITINDLIGITKKHNLYLEIIKNNEIKKVDNVNLPAIIELDGISYLLLKIDKNKKTFYIQDMLTPNEEVKKIKKNPDNIYLILNKDEDEIFKKDDDWIKEIIKNEKGSYIKIFYISFFINIFMLITPFYMMSIYDRVLPLEGVATLITLTIGVLMIYSFDLIFKYVRTNIIQEITFKINNSIEKLLINKIIKIKKSYDKYSSGNKLNLFKEINIIKDFFSSQTMIIFLEIPFFLIGLFLISIFSETLIYIPIVISIIMLIINLITQSKIEKIYNSLYLKENFKSDYLLELLYTKKEIVNSNLLDDKEFEGIRILEEQENINKKISFIKGNLTNVFQYLVQITTILMMFFGSLEVINGTMTVGYLMALTILTSRVMMPIVNINMNMLKFHDVKKSFKIINSFFKLPIIDNYKKLIVNNLKGNYKVEKLTFKYNNKILFEDINFEIKEKDKIAIVGENGVGKTTLKNILLGIEEPLEGNIYIDNHNLKKININKYNGDIGIMENEPIFFKGTMLKNIDLQNRYSKEELIKKMDELNLKNVIGNNIELLNMQVEEQGKNLSDGEKQLINFIRMIIYKPDILILDEPTKNLDPGLEIRIKKYLFNYCKDRTMILITNKINMLDITTSVRMIQDKKLTEKMKTQEFINKINGGK
jgi:ATP-binding cassette subfamily B protein/ATP-binding cassette subfamily C protein LapB